MSVQKQVEDLTAEMSAMRQRHEAEGEKHQNEIAEWKDLIERLQAGHLVGPQDGHLASHLAGGWVTMAVVMSATGFELGAAVGSSSASELGAGNGGVVHCVRHTSTGTVIAKKMIHLEVRLVRLIMHFLINNFKEPMLIF